MRTLTISLFLITILLCSCQAPARIEEYPNPDWAGIKSNALFYIPDPTYGTPFIQPLNVGGWEDGLYITRDGLELYAIYLPIDAFSLNEALKNDPVCFDYLPYFRPPDMGIDLITNPWGCNNFFQGDIIISSRTNLSCEFTLWESSNLKRSVSNEGGACGILKDSETFDVFLFTQNRNDVDDMEIMLMKDVPRNPSITDQISVPIVSTEGVEDNPHIERLDGNTLLLFFDRDRYMYYTKSEDNGDSWNDAVLFSGILNAQAPYDVQPHLWNDGTDWWVYFCADNENGVRCIYKSIQLISGNWDSWGERILVIEPVKIAGELGMIIGVGEPSLTDDGDISFVTIYGDPRSQDITDVYDCDPWFLPRK